MSGGSYNYIRNKGIEDLMSYDNREEIGFMANTLDEFGELGQKAAEKTRHILQRLNEIKAEMDALDLEKDEIAHIWRQVDYWQSMDSSKESVIEALNQFNL